MDEKAANEGDRLKHPLTLEVLGRCSAWKSLTYAETHAGAGRYLASGQMADKPHIARLDDKVSREKRPAVDSEAGGQYLALLRDWWDDSNTVGAYPGSVLQSARFLSRWRSVGSWEIRATEADKATSERLSTSLKGLGIETKHEGFQTQVDWLTQNDNLILLVDPYSYFAIDDGEGRDKARTKALNKGRIDQEAMDSLFDRCWGKSACVVLFWCAFAHEPGAENKRLVKDWLGEKTSKRGARLRWFRRGIYNTAVIGIGVGAAVVRDLPGTGEWKQSWMTGFITEET